MIYENSGQLEILEITDKGKTRIICNEHFETIGELKKVLYFLKGKNVEVVVTFDMLEEIEDNLNNFEQE